MKKKTKLSTRIFITFICGFILFPMFAPAPKVEALIMPVGIKLVIQRIEKSIPKKLKKSNGNIDLGQFKDKNNKTPLTKSSGSFKSTKDGNWTVEKDTAGHGGRKYKLKKNGTRVASLDGNGKVIGP